MYTQIIYFFSLANDCPIVCKGFVDLCRCCSEKESSIGKTSPATVIKLLNYLLPIYCKGLPNGLRYLRWGGDGEAVQLEK